MNAIQKILLAVVAAVTVVADARAGRWLSRDPIEEGAGFVQRDPMPKQDFRILRTAQATPQAARFGAVPTQRSFGALPIGNLATALLSDIDDEDGATTLRMPPNEMNLYAFVLNDPQNHVDLLGLISFDGCDSGQQAQLTSAWNDACSLLKDPKFRCCVNRSRLLQMFERRCNWGNVKFKCRENDQGLCPWVCAHAWQSLGIGRGVIVVCRRQFDNPLECPLNLKCTLMHEMTHILGGTPFENGVVEKVEKCCVNN